MDWKVSDLGQDARAISRTSSVGLAIGLEVAEGRGGVRVPLEWVAQS